MLNYEELRTTSKAYWDDQPRDVPTSLNGFAGTFAFESHQSIPSALRNVIEERFYTAPRFTRIELDDINEFLNSIWDGPGSMSKIVDITHELRSVRKAGQTVDLDRLYKGYVTPTVDSDLQYAEE